MALRIVAFRWFRIVTVCSATLLLVRCSSNEVELPVVTEESLTPEQKAQFDRLRNIQADVLQRAGANDHVAMTPEEIANQRFQEDQARRAQENGSPSPSGAEN